MHRVALAILTVGMAVGTARAETADDYFEQGRKKLAENKAGEACELFGKAIQLDPMAAGTMLNLGLCNENLGRYKTALFWFRKAQARALEKQLPDHEKAARDHMEQLTKKVRTVKVVVAPPVPPGTRIKIDGEELVAAEYDHAEVDTEPPAPAKHHVLEAAAPGMKFVSIDFDLPPVPAGVEPPPPYSVAVVMTPGDNTIIVDRGAGRRKAAMYTAIAGGVLWGADGVVAILAKTRYDSYKDAHNNTAANKWVDRAETYGTGLFVAGGVALTVAAVLYFTAPQKERIERTVFVPTVGPDGVGFGFAGSF